MRLLICAALLAVAAFPVRAAPADPKMLELAEKSRCLQCHDIQAKISGPPWIEVARRYRDTPSMVEPLVRKVREGGSGVWGDEIMSPNKRVPEQDIRTLVRWILTLE